MVCWYFQRKIKSRKIELLAQGVVNDLYNKVYNFKFDDNYLDLITNLKNEYDKSMLWHDNGVNYSIIEEDVIE